jgi:glycosidase
MIHSIDLQRFIISSRLGFATLIVLFITQLPYNVKAQLTVEPPHWWVGMPDENLEILIHSPQIGTNSFELKSDGEGVSLVKVETFPNSNYAVLRLSIEPSASAQTLEFRSKGEAGKVRFNYELKNRAEVSRGLDPSDIIYLITPDRFANADPENDSIEGMEQTGINREEPYDRHGGDIQGIIDHLDFIQELGMTAIWPNPLLENDQPRESYHGYAITNHYQIDPRFGSLDLFRTLMDSLNRRNLKMVMDVVYNHLGDRHHLYTDIPDSSWFHFHDGFLKTNYRAPSLMDPYASKYDKHKMTDGWFDTHMPDLNQDNPFVRTYFTQQTLWWIEEFGIQALRIDTYAYPDQAYMREWGKAVKEAFPDIFLFAETWVHGIPVQAWFLGDGLGPEENFIDGLTDFQLHYAINDALSQSQSWTGGVSKIYYTLAGDYVYEEPLNMVTFLDNHDLARFYGHVQEDFDRYKIGLGLLMTMRGIPSLYYGTEILMSETDGHGKIREDFPGGWPGDSLNKFIPEGRSELENRAVDWIKTLTQYREKHPALQTGNTTQYVPVDNLYVYFRWNEEEVIMVAVNRSDETAKSPKAKYQEFFDGKSSLIDLEGASLPIGDTLTIPPQSIQIFEVK